MFFKGLRNGLIISLLLWGIIIAVCFADITSTLNQTWTEKEQAQAAFTARATLQNANMVVEETLNRLQEIKDSGHFDTLPPDLKQVLNRWWQIYKDVKTDIQSDTKLMEIYQWHP